MKMVLKTAAVALALGLASPVLAAGGGDGPALKQVDWSFNGVFGQYDKGQLQRGLQVFREVCSACHGLDLVFFRDLSDLGYSEDEIKALASEYEVEDGPDDEGEMYTRGAIPADRFPNPFPNSKAAAASNDGAVPPDLSLMAKARVGGPDYIYSLLTGYHEEAPQGFDLPEGKSYNDYFAGHAISMAPPLYDEAVEYADGTQATLDQQAQDVSAFLMWAAEPKLDARKSTGMKVMLFLLVFTALWYAVKRKIWADIH